MKDRSRPLAARIAELKPALVPAALRSLYPFLVGIVIAFLLQVMVAPAIGDYYARILLDIGIAIVLAASLNIVNGFAGQFSLGHAGFMLVGGYGAAMVTYYGSIKLGWVPIEGCLPNAPAGAECAQEVGVYGGFMGPGDLLFLVACLVGGAFAAIAGLVVGLPSLRLRGDYLAIVTLGFGEILRVLVQQTKEVPDPVDAADVGIGFMFTHLGGASPFTGVPSYVSATPWLQDASGNNPGHAGIFFAFVFVGILLVLAYRLKTSAKGRELLAVRENEVAAEAMGVDTAKAKVSAFVMSAFFAGVGGGLFAHQVGTSLSPKDLGFQKSIDLVIMVVLGGMGSISGVVFAAAILTLLPELFRSFSDYRMPIYALALIIVMIVRPQGLFGIKELWDLGPWRRRVIPIWRKVAGGWLIPKHEERLPEAIAKELSTERADANLASRQEDDKS
jgi:branched-chain amino acid transport system permease protein